MNKKIKLDKIPLSSKERYRQTLYFRMALAGASAAAGAYMLVPYPRVGILWLLLSLAGIVFGVFELMKTNRLIKKSDLYKVLQEPEKILLVLEDDKDFKFPVLLTKDSMTRDMRTYPFASNGNKLQDITLHKNTLFMAIVSSAGKVSYNHTFKITVPDSKTTECAQVVNLIRETHIQK